MQSLIGRSLKVIGTLGKAGHFAGASLGALVPLLLALSLRTTPTGRSRTGVPQTKTPTDRPTSCNILGAKHRALILLVAPSALPQPKLSSTRPLSGPRFFDQPLSTTPHSFRGHVCWSSFRRTCRSTVTLLQVEVDYHLPNNSEVAPAMYEEHPGRVLLSTSATE